MNNFLALKLSEQINNLVLTQSKKYGIDLNSIEFISKNCLQIGEGKTSSIILVRLKCVETFVNGECVNSDVIKMNVPTRYRLENPTLEKAINNGFIVRVRSSRAQKNSPMQKAFDLNYKIVKMGFGFGLTSALYDNEGQLVAIGDYKDIMEGLNNV